MKLQRPLVIIHDGKATQLFIDNKLYGDGVTKIAFEHVGEKWGVRRGSVDLEVAFDDVTWDGQTGKQDEVMLMVENIVKGEKTLPTN